MSKPINFPDRYFEIIKSLGITANIMISPSHSGIKKYEYHEPLVLKWGYIEDLGEDSYAFFEHVASTFNSPIAWTLETFTREAKIYPNGFSKWWLFYPTRINDIIEKRGLSRNDARMWLEKNEPEFGIQTNEELYNFISHLDDCYKDWIKKEKLKLLNEI